tara:strand:- start:818 stop:2260 length:1443 start_codon:yes stop_codon:yes gene_type:complete
MLFNSLHYLLFFPALVVVYFIIAPKWRTYLLLAASYYFYMCWKPEYVVLILGSTIVDYLVAIKIHKSEEKSLRRRWLLVSLISNLSVLFLFKYFNFFSENIHTTLNSLNIFYERPVFDLLLPVGISFYTFQTLSYSIDVYKGKLEPEKNFSRFALFVSFFPQLVAGPIERATHLLPQFKKTYYFEYKRVVSGLRLVLWGFFKKVVIADNLSQVVDQVYNNPADQNGVTYIVASYFFAFQIYCDFSGYSDIAIGSARIMGFDLMENFKQPYLSKSIKEFWSRWHISLSTWFRDYVYIPLGGNRSVKWRWYYNLFLTFLISGLWHGANWTFIIWGAFHGILLIIGIHIAKVLKAPTTSIGKWTRVIIIFHLVLLGWIFFRADNVSIAFNILQDIAHIPWLISDFLNGTSIFTGFGEFSISTIAYFSFLIIILYSVDWMSTKEKITSYYLKTSWLRMLTYFILFYWIMLGGFFDKTSFIYFQF